MLETVGVPPNRCLDVPDGGPNAQFCAAQLHTLSTELAPLLFLHKKYVEYLGLKVKKATERREQLIRLATVDTLRSRRESHQDYTKAWEPIFNREGYSLIADFMVPTPLAKAWNEAAKMVTEADLAARDAANKAAAERVVQLSGPVKAILGVAMGDAKTDMRKTEAAAILKAARNEIPERMKTQWPEWSIKTKIKKLELLVHPDQALTRGDDRELSSDAFVRLRSAIYLLTANMQSKTLTASLQ